MYLATRTPSERCLYSGSKGPVHSLNSCLSHSSKLAQHSYRTSPRAAPSCHLSVLAYRLVPASPWVCLLLKHNPAPMEMTGSNTLLPTQQISVNKAGLWRPLPGTPTARGSPHPIHRAETFPKMSQWQAQSLELTSTPGFFI